MAFPSLLVLVLLALKMLMDEGASFVYVPSALAAEISSEFSSIDSLLGGESSTETSILEDLHGDRRLQLLSRLDSFGTKWLGQIENESSESLLEKYRGRKKGKVLDTMMKRFDSYMSSIREAPLEKLNDVLSKMQSEGIGFLLKELYPNDNDMEKFLKDMVRASRAEEP